ncbi:MAG: hypothetical protein KAG53_08380 [Endozoicomonadaceae bacterium]|nr:hypothetical protein [Endozoicomonadaceae bacterium]
MSKIRLVVVGIVSGIIVLECGWLLYDYVKVESPLATPEHSAILAPVPAYLDDELDSYSDESNVTRIIVNDSLTGGDVDIDQVLSGKVVVDDKVVNPPPKRDDDRLKSVDSISGE